MAATAIAASSAFRSAERRPELRLVRREARSLADVVDLAWTALQAEAPVACLVCDGRMEPRMSATGVAGGRCRDCGTELS